MFVASTVNILDLKDGIDTEAAGARLALSLEILRNATSTPSNARSVEIIEQLMGKDVASPAEQTRLVQTHQVWPQLPPLLAVPSGGSRRPSLQSTRPANVTSPQPLYTPTTDLLPQQQLEFNLSKTPAASGFPTFFDQPNMLSPSNIQVPMDSQVEIPMRWLADNVGTNTRPELWITMDMGFNNTFNDQYPTG